MKITLTQPAVKWFQEEMEAKSGDYIRFFARYGGYSSIQPGFSLGVSKSNFDQKAAALAEYDGIVFFIDEKDNWYFKDHHLHVKYSRKYNEIEYEYVKN
ncbi:HesB/YadR/YfhF family protein [Alteribacillus sp. YIM 98480]|uniref:HesB/YadR/YfhF family protein n=1 Tax=Alteribacillus sp. YIM 98480 TaxID=2606599 RepID=UPI00131DC66D|nr:HesB/YadR/YfhF family protein [Alteribacillus sp. YIM 98480]